MRGLLTIYRRELAGLFLGPLAWILLAVSLLLSGWLFVAVLKDSGGDVTVSLRYTMGASTALVFLPPLLTMRMISEETRTGMLEFLLTAPVSDASVVLGKFLAALSFMSLFWLSKVVYALAIGLLGTQPDWAPVLGGYLGAVLTSALFCAIGLLSSAGFGTPILAAFVGLIANIIVLLLPMLARLAARDWVREAVDLVNVSAHFDTFLRGVVDTSALVFFVVWTAVLLFLATRLIEVRRWR